MITLSQSNGNGGCQCCKKQCPPYDICTVMFDTDIGNLITGAQNGICTCRGRNSQMGQWDIVGNPIILNAETPGWYWTGLSSGTITLYDASPDWNGGMCEYYDTPDCTQRPVSTETFTFVFEVVCAPDRGEGFYSVNFNLTNSGGPGGYGFGPPSGIPFYNNNGYMGMATLSFQ